MLTRQLRPDAFLESILQLPRRANHPETLGALWGATQTPDGIGQDNAWSAFGALWDAALPTDPKHLMGPFQLQALKRMTTAHPGFKDPSCLREPGRHVAIVTTASLPWMTGTAVNPLLRAAFLADKSSERRVTLVIPWLNMVDQLRVFPNNITFTSPEEQETFVRTWVEKRTGRPSNFKVSFYPGRFASEKGSILPVGDITQVRIKPRGQ